MYSIFYHTKFNDNNIGVNPMFMVKGICNELGLRFLTNVKIEKSLRSVRRKMYQDENAFFFKVGYELRENLFVKYEVTDIERTKDDILVTVRPIGYRLGKPEKVFSEEQLYNRTCAYESIDDVKVDMRKNRVVISGSSDVGITTVVKELMKQCPELNKTVSVTTRKTFENEVNGKDYYFVSMEELLSGKEAKESTRHTIAQFRWRITHNLYWQGERINRFSDEYQNLLDRAYEALSQNSDFEKALKDSLPCALAHSIGKTDVRKTVFTEYEFISRLFDLLPDNLTYPSVTPQLFKRTLQNYYAEQRKNELHIIKNSCSTDFNV